MTAPPPSPGLMHLLTRAERLLSRRVAGILDGEGYSLDAWRVITLLSDGAGHFMTELAERAFLPPATLTKLVDHLVEDTVLYRRVDDVDRRRIRAYLTPRGHTLYRRVSERIDAVVAELPAGEALPALLAHLIDALDGTSAPVHDLDAYPVPMLPHG